MRRVVVLVLALALAGCQSSARMRWDRIGPGPELEYAQAQCNILAMGVGQNSVAIGSPTFVAGAAIGDALATGMQQQEFRKNCMIMQGWKQVPDIRGRPPVMKAAPGSMNEMLTQWGAASNKCAVDKDQEACKRRDALEVRLKAMGAHI